MITKYLKVWIGAPRGVPPVIRLSQYDTAWRLVFTVYNGAELYQIPEGAAAAMEGRKADGTVFAYAGTVEDGTVRVDCGEQMTSARGDVVCELRFSSGGTLAGTANFILRVEAAPLDGYVASGDDFSAVDQLVSQALTAAAESKAAAAEAKDEVLESAPQMVSDWLEDNVDPETGYVIDSSLSVTGAAADAKAAGDAANELFSSGSIIAEGLCDLAGHYEASRLTNDSKINGSGTKVTGAPGFARTNILNGDSFPADAIEIPDSSLCFQLVGYSTITFNATVYVSQTPFVRGGAGRLLYRRADWPYFAVVVKRWSGEATSFTSAELTSIAGLITRYTYNDAAARLGEAEEEIVERTTFDYDASELAAGYGGLLNTGKSWQYTTRIRIKPATGLAAFKVLAGSVITPAAGYKFNVAMYSRYVSNSDFDLIGFESLRTTAYTVPYDCYIRIGVGTTNDDELWTITDNVYALTQAGENALENALTLDLKGGTVKGAIEDIQALLDRELDTIHTIDSIPLNATAYHALWAELMAEHADIERTLIAEIGGSSSYPVYMYTVRTDMDHLAANYSRVQWDGSNELYARPKIFLSSGIHGSERGTPMALLEFFRSLFDDPKYQAMRNAFDWYVLPLCNPWGFSNTAYHDGTPRQGAYYPGEGDTVQPNTSAVHIGIRQNADGKDCNRHFYTHTSPSDPMPAETQAVMDALAAATADGRDFVFAMDMHQAWTGSANNAIGAFLSMSYGASAADKSLIYGKWMQAGAVTERDFAEYTDRENVQSVFPWDGTNASTLRNYLAEFADYATCFEGGIKCLYYGGTSELSNPVACAFASTQMHNFMRSLTAIWM